MALLEPALEQAEPLAEQRLAEQPLAEQLLAEQPREEQLVEDQLVAEQPLAEQLLAEQPREERLVEDQLVAEQLVVEMVAEEGHLLVDLVPLATKWSLGPRKAAAVKALTVAFAVAMESQAEWLPGPHHKRSTMHLT